MCKIEQNFKRKYTQATTVMLFFAQVKPMLVGENFNSQPFPPFKRGQPVNQQGGTLPRSAKAVT